MVAGDTRNLRSVLSHELTSVVLGYREARDTMNERLTVLVVDDEHLVLITAAAVLSEDFRVLTAKDATAALKQMERNTIDVVCTDFSMPGKNGIQLLREAMARQPHLSGVLVTGHAEYLEKRDEYEVQGLYYLLIKPYEPKRLVEIVQRAAESARLKRVMSSLSSELEGWKRMR
jgi:DNA-binding NtrC family response regulator